MPALTVDERFFSKVRMTSECWVWTGGADSSGYGRFYPGGGRGVGMRAAHRVSYESIVGPIPEGLDLDHLCRVKHCVRPDHLEPVTRRENLMRGPTVTAAKARQTHCIHGHEFTPENTCHDPNGTRKCRTCITLRARRYRWLRSQS